MKLLKEPLVHFLVLAIMLFAVEHVFSSAQKEQIIVDEQAAAFLIKQREDLVLRMLSEQERQDTIASYVEDEILYSEAYKRGLDKGDSRMRRNMILKMRGLLVGDISDPTEDELRAYFKSHREDFMNPAEMSLDHVFFSDASQVPQGLLGQLKAGVDHDGLGESMSAFGSSIANISQRWLVSIFGPEAARGIIEIEDEQWHGPFESVNGVHFVRITGRTPAVQPAYEEVKSYLEAKWVLAESRKLIEQELASLRDNYEIIIETDSESAR